MKDYTQLGIFEKYYNELQETLTMSELQRIAGRAYLLLRDEQLLEQYREAVIDRMELMERGAKRIPNAIAHLVNDDTAFGQAYSRSKKLLLAVYIAGYQEGQNDAKKEEKDQEEEDEYEAWA